MHYFFGGEKVEVLQFRQTNEKNVKKMLLFKRYLFWFSFYDFVSFDLKNQPRLTHMAAIYLPRFNIINIFASSRIWNITSFLCIFIFLLCCTSWISFIQGRGDIGLKIKLISKIPLLIDIQTGYSFKILIEWFYVQTFQSIIYKSSFIVLSL